MNKFRFVLISVVLLLLFSSCSLGSVPGIDEPVEVRGVDLQFIDVDFKKSVNLGGQTSQASAPYDIIVVVQATTNADNVNAPCEWRGDEQVNLSWTYEGGPDDNDWGICSSNEVDESKSVTYYFASMMDGEDYVLTLPGDVQIPLDSLID